METQKLKQAFGTFMTGVTVTTTVSQEGRPIGFTANSFTSVSLDPPLLLVCLGSGSRHFQNFCESEYFGINILSEDQMHLSETFASDIVDRFSGVDWYEGAGKVPLLGGVVAWFVCKTTQIVTGGDHQIIIGEVTDFEIDEDSKKDGLGYYKGSYFTVPTKSHERWG